LLKTSTLWRQISPGTGSGARRACGKTPGVETPRASDGWSVGAAAADGDNPCETNIHERHGFRLIGKQPQKLNGTLTAAFGDPYFFWANRLLVACHALKRVAKRAGIERRNGNGIVALYAFFGSEFEPDGGIAAQGSLQNCRPQASSQLTYIYKDEINENGRPRLERCWPAPA
jgi:hypothetical protein